MGDRDLTAGIDASELGEKPIAGKVGSEDVVLVRDGNKLCAFSGSCTHLGAPLADGIVVDGELRCPWHHARFSVETGEAVASPAFEPLDRYDVVERDGRIVVGAKLAAEERSEVPRSDLGRIVIVGGGAAGHACAEMLGRMGAGDAVTVLSAEADPPYDRTQCSKQYLMGKAERGDTSLPIGPEPTVRTETQVMRLDLEGGAVELAGGERIPFDRLVLATGAEPSVPDFDGSDRDDVFTVRTLADADRLIAAAKGAKAAIVIGSSYVGLEVAASLTQRGLSVTVVAEGDIPLEKTAGPEVGGLVRSLHEAKGVVFRMGATVKSWNGSEATLDDGSTASGQLLVAGTGAKPRLGLADEAGIAIAGKEAGGGVAVDGTLRTSAANVYAIGDIASVPDARLGHPIRVEHWVVAQRMGQWLARHLLGRIDGDYSDLPFFWSGHYDTSLRYVGHVASPEDRTVEGDVEKKDFAVTFAEDARDCAQLSCGRDVQSLEAEAEWER